MPSSPAPAPVGLFAPEFPLAYRGHYSCGSLGYDDWLRPLARFPLGCFHPRTGRFMRGSWLYCAVYPGDGELALVLESALVARLPRDRL